MFLGYTDRPNFGKALFPTLPPGTVPINDAINFITAAGITDNTQQLAIINLVGDLKAYGLWDKLKAIYPFIGGTANSHKFNLKDSRDVDAAFRLSFAGGWTHNANGATPNGTNGFADTFFAINTLNSGHLSIYSRTNSDGLFTDIGALNTLTSNYSAILIRYINLFYGGINQSLGAANVTSNSTESIGMFITSRILSNSLSLYKNNALLVNSSSVSTDIVGFSCYIGAQNNSNTPVRYSNRQYAFASIGDGLTNADAANLYTAVQAYQTTLGRQV